jgi:hypothetical protein
LSNRCKSRKFDETFFPSNRNQYPEMRSYGVHRKIARQR